MWQNRKYDSQCDYRSLHSPTGLCLRLCLWLAEEEKRLYNLDWFNMQLQLCYIANNAEDKNREIWGWSISHLSSREKTIDGKSFMGEIAIAEASDAIPVRATVAEELREAEETTPLALAISDRTCQSILKSDLTVNNERQSHGGGGAWRGWGNKIITKVGVQTRSFMFSSKFLCYG